MKKVWQEIKNNTYTVFRRMCSIRFLTFIIMLFFFMDLFLSGYRDNVRSLREQANILILPFLQTSKSFLKFAFLGVVYFYSNVPFMEKSELFYISRLGKIRWSLRNVWYIIVSSWIISILFLITSVVEVAAVSKVSNVWDGVIKTLSLANVPSVHFQVPYQILQEYKPFLLFLIIMFLNWLVIMFLGLFMYVISLYGKRILACILSVLIVFMPSIDILLGNVLLYYSPVSWIDCNNWRIGYEPDKPGLSYIFVAILFMDILLMICAWKRAIYMEWRTEES